MRRKSRQIALGIGLALACLGSGCGLLGGQTGQENTAAGMELPPKPPDCSMADTTEVALDDRNALNFSAQQALDANAGPLRAPLSWYTRGERAEITVEVHYLGGAVQAVRALSFGVSVLCNELQLPAELTLKSDDGLLDETVLTTLHVTSADKLSASLRLPLETLQGSYDGSELTLSDSARQALEVSVVLSKGSTTGMISVTDDSPADSATDDASTLVAGWP